MPTSRTFIAELMDPQLPTNSLWIICVASLLVCFFGYRFFRYFLSLAGAVILGGASWLGLTKVVPENWLLCLGASVLAACVGAWLFHKLFKMAAFSYGAATGVALAPVILPFVLAQIEGEPAVWVKWAVPAACALVGGLLLLISRRAMMIVMTASSGAVYFTNALFLLLVNFEVFEKTVITQPGQFHASLWFLSFTICAAGGAMYQFKDKDTKS
ncbi:MAG: DUF4203 domain-containing protein [Lentisphaeraceae bacterium]|nr:DUF4203 domain-containing protein [Lentisphaeraceae bacterium]